MLIHGGYGQGSDWISTPDGRRGWATLLLEQGYKVYVLDRPGQGRNPYHPCVHGNFDREAPTFEAAASASAHGVRSERSSRRPAGRVDGPADGATIAITQNVWRTRGAMLLDEIGPAILVTHGDGAVLRVGDRAGAAEAGEGHRGGRTGRMADWQLR